MARSCISVSVTGRTLAVAHACPVVSDWLLDRWEQGERDHCGWAEVDSAVGLDRPVVAEGEFGSNQAVVELARLDLERLHISCQLLLAAFVHDLEGCGARMAEWAIDDDAEVRLDGDGNRSGSRK